MGIGSIILIAVLAIVAFASWIWLVVVAFQKSALWGILVLILGLLTGPPIAIVFAVMNWQEAKKPFLLYMGSTIIFVVLYFNLIFSVINEMGVMENMQQVESGEISEEEAQRRMEVRMLEMFGQEVPPELREEIKPASTADEIAALTEQLNQQSQEPITAAEPKQVQVFNPFKLNQAPQYIGQTIRVVSKSGVEKQGKLKAVKYDRLVMERNLRGGDFSFEVMNKDIKTLEIQQWETY